jgi:hypothetical protein
MAFSVPTFPLLCDVYRGPWLTRVLAIHDLACNLAWGRRVSLATNEQDFNEFALCPTLLVPALSDIRDLKCRAVEDVVEVPSGSGRWYQVASVDDIGKGFSNEHRGVVIFPISENLFPTGSYAGLNWPAPIP